MSCSNLISVVLPECQEFVPQREFIRFSLSNTDSKILKMINKQYNIESMNIAGPKHGFNINGEHEEGGEFEYYIGYRSNEGKEFKWVFNEI